MRSRISERWIFITLLIASLYLTARANAAYDSARLARAGVDSILATPCKPVDLIDVGRSLFKIRSNRSSDGLERKAGALYPSVIPGPSYNMQTGFQAVLNLNVAFYTCNDPNQNLSTIFSSTTYTQKKQLVIPLQASIWTKNNKYNIVVDWHYSIFPQLTYGLGGYTTLNNGYTISFHNLRLVHTFYKAIAKDMLLGIGYNYDYFWKFSEMDPPANTTTDLQKYGIKPHERASGIALNFEYDTRRNSINPIPGSKYINILYKPHFTYLYSDNNWQSVSLDVRDYVRFPASSNNILALWNYDMITMGNNPPYLLLPGTGGDSYNNTGRGYVPGRFRGRDMLYVETEYRFSLACNGLFGGVVFANAQSLLEETSHHFDKIRPACGIGLRSRLNKFSKTNIAIDYAVGTGGSRGFYFNIGEVF